MLLLFPVGCNERSLLLLGDNFCVVVVSQVTVSKSLLSWLLLLVHFINESILSLYFVLLKYTEKKQ